MRNTVVSYVREFFFSNGIKKKEPIVEGPTSAEILKVRLIADKQRQAEIEEIKNIPVSKPKIKLKKKKGGKNNEDNR